MGVRLSRDISELRQSLFSKIEAVQDEYQAKGWLPARLNLNKGIVRGILEMFCWGQWQLYNFLSLVHKQAIPLDSESAWLDTHAEQVNCKRRPATKARGNVRFLRGSFKGNLIIPKGRIVRTNPDGLGNIYRFVTLEQAVLSQEADSVPVLAEAEEYGTGGNAAVGQICELVTPVEGIGGVSNDAGWLVSEGANEETDEQLKERYRLAWAANNGCTKYAYQSRALSVPGVTSVSILDRHPRGQGTVDIVVRGADVMPTEALLAKVREAIAPNTPINDDWLVKGPVAVPCAISGIIEYFDVDPESVTSQAENRLRALFMETSPYEDIKALQIGQDLTLDLLTHTVMGVAGVKRVIWQSPKDAVINVPADGVATLASLNLSGQKATEL